MLFQCCDLELIKCFSTSSLHSIVDLCFLGNLLIRRYIIGSSVSGVLTEADSRTGESITSVSTKCPHKDDSVRACSIQGYDRSLSTREHILEYDRSLSTREHILEYDRSLSTREHIPEYDRSLSTREHILEYDRSISTREHILEYCFVCKRFGVYDFVTRKAMEVTCEDKCIRPHAMCKGPHNSLIIYDKAAASILQFTFSNSQLHNKRRVHCLDPDSPVKSICYNEHNGIVVVLLASKSGSAKIKGINLATGQEHWHRHSVPKSRYVCSGNEVIFISGYGNDVTMLDAADGLYLGTILGNEQLGCIHKVVCSEEHAKLAALHENGRLTCYSLRKKHVALSR